MEFVVDGMTCVNCAKTIEKALAAKGLKEIYVNYATREVRFGDTDLVDEAEIIEIISGLGYVVQGHTGKGSFWTLKRKFILAAIFTIPLFAHMFIPWHTLHNPWVQLGLCIPVFIIGIFHFGKSAVKSALLGVPNMDVLIFIGSTAAFVYSLSGLLLNLGPDYMFFETSAMIITLVLLGNLLEERSINQTTTSIRELTKLQAPTANLVEEDENGTYGLKIIAADLLKVGDVVQVNEGDKVPADGTVLAGSAAIDEAMISGESVPVEKDIGSSVIGASLVQSGNIKVSVTAIGKDTVLSQIIQLVKSAQSDQPDIQRLGDKISSIFVPAVVGISVLTFFVAYYGFGVSFQKSLLNSIAVLVISCPCAMGLATPTAVMVGIGRAAREGILFRSGKALELLAKVNRVIFDKTGTLTSGDYKVSDFRTYNGSSDKEIKRIIKTMEMHSSHPIAKSLMNEFEKVPADYPFESIQEMKGVGVKAKDKQGIIYQIGSNKIVPEQEQLDDGRIYLIRSKLPLASFKIDDKIRSGTKEVVAFLKEQKIIPIILSGDKIAHTKTVANEIGVQEVYAEKLPAEKIDIVSNLSKEFQTAMVGDGINDAPALQRASVGISLSDSSQVAISSADVILLKGKISNLTEAIKISKATYATIKQNLFWAFAYNVVAIPIAAMGYLNPMWGAIFMAFSDIVVIGNSLRLKSRKNI